MNLAEVIEFVISENGFSIDSKSLIWHLMAFIFVLYRMSYVSTYPLLEVSRNWEGSVGWKEQLVRTWSNSRIFFGALSTKLK